MRKARKLTLQQRRFCAEYLLDGIGTDACRRIGAHPKLAAKWLARPDIQSSIARRRRAQEIRTEISADRALRALWEIASFDIGRALDPDGRLLALADMPGDVRRAVAFLQVLARPAAGEDAVVQRLRVHDKVRALELVAKHLGMFSTPRSLDGVDRLGERLDAAIARVRIVVASPESAS